MPKTTFSKHNHNRQAPRWFRKLKRAILILTMAANSMIAGWGFPDPLFVARVQVWCSVGIGAILEFLEVWLADDEDEIAEQAEDPPIGRIE